MSEKELEQSSSVIKILMSGSQKLREIISSIKPFGDKHHIGYYERVSTSILIAPKFVKSTEQDSKFKLVSALLMVICLLRFNLFPLVR